MRPTVIAILLLAVVALSAPAHAQTADLQSTPAGAQNEQADSVSQKQAYPYTARVALRPAFKNFVRDQEDIWTSPFKARIQDLNWIVPVTGLTAGMLNADAELSSRISTTGAFASHSSTFSNAGLGAALGGSGVLWLAGKWRGDEHQQETGILAMEATADSLVVTEGVKLLTQRERLTDGTGQGRFWHSSSPFDSSFPSAHAMLTWSAVSVLVHEYPSTPTKLLGYGLATGVSVARVAGRDHFPSDVIVGSTMGWLIGRQVYSRHHTADSPAAGYGTFQKELGLKTDERADSTFSPYIPTDSWIYPAFERLIALGAIPGGFLGIRPWTRRESARLLEEAHVEAAGSRQDEVARLYSALVKEFAEELGGRAGSYAQLESVYARATGISGTPLTDGYHFGRTIVNDFGRPYQNGTNGLTGFSTSGSSGALGFYIRGEFEHAGAAPGVSQAVQDALQISDEKPPMPASPVPRFNQFRLLDTYVSLNLKDWQTSFGKQSLWLGPTQDPFLWSNNAEPIYMLRVDRITPITLPGILRFLGPMRTEFWAGKLTGQHFVNTQDGNIAVSLGRTLERQPMVNGAKISFKPTPNFEFGVGKTGLWGGPDFPITLGSTRRSLFATTNAVGRGFDPGDRRSTFDWSYRIPGLRRWLTVYEDSFVEDEISPIGYPRRAAHNPGLYLSQMPFLRHLDLRVEAAYTNLPDLREPPGGGFFYWNVRYLDGYTNQGNIIGNGTVGRQGISFRGQSTYWFASDKTIQVGYRGAVSDPMFAKGGALRDVYARSEWMRGRGLSLSTFLQYEWWNFPLLTAGRRQSDLAASLQLTYWPHRKAHDRSNRAD